MTVAPPIVHVVDDDAAFRSAIARLLGASGYQVALYSSASELLEKLPDGGPGCILLDVKMSGLNGPQLQERLGATVVVEKATRGLQARRQRPSITLLPRADPCTAARSDRRDYGTPYCSFAK